jgi:hypothetical protein
MKKNWIERMIEHDKALIRELEAQISILERELKKEAQP